MTSQTRTAHVSQPASVWWALLLVASVCTATVALHLRQIDGDFLSDDLAHLSWMATASQGEGLLSWLGKHLHTPLPTGNFAYRPLAFASYAFNWALFDSDPAGWRITNMAIHLANVALVFAVARRLATREGLRDTFFPAAAAAALFAAIPFAGEVTYWLVGRFNLLACMFSLAFLALLLEVRPGAERYRAVAAAFCALLAMTSNESAIPILVAGLILLVNCNS